MAVAVTLSAPLALAQAPKVLKFVPQADLRILDPITTTAYITRNHGYMIYDTLFATDAKFQVQPQMVDKYELSGDQADVHVHAARRAQVPRRPAGALGRLHRLDRALGEARRAGPEARGSDRLVEGRQRQDVHAQAQAAVSARARSARRSRRRTCRSSCPSASPRPMRSTNITEPIGSGPFKFVKEEWVPGSKVVYVKNTDYVPRKEPPSWAAGGKVVKVDRVEWIYIPDSATAAAALNAGEVDWWEQMPPDLIPVLAKNKDIKVENIDPLGSMGMIRFNFMYPPFNNPKMRQALLYADRPERLRHRHRRRREERPPVLFLFHLRHAAVERSGRRADEGQARLRQGKAADQGSRLQGREDRHHLGDRSADRPFADRC